MRAPPPLPPPRPARPKRPRPARSADDGDDDWSPSRCVRPAQRRSRSTVRRGAAKSKFQPPVKRTATVTSAETAPAASSAVCGEHVQSQERRPVTTEEAAKEADRSPHRPPSPPYDFIGFTLEDQFKARHAVDTKAELLWNHIIAEFKDLGEEPPEREVFKRRRNTVNYREEEDLDDDDYIFCDECDREWEGDCPVHGPLEVVPDTKVPFDTGDPERDIKTRPEFLNPGRSKIPGANTGIWTEKDLPARLRFGPYEGIVTADRRQATDSGYSWEIKKCRRVHHYVNAGDSSSSNWLRLVNCARFEQEQNLIAFQYKGQMYYRTYKPIVKGSELLVYYGDAYARELNINVQTFRKAPAAAPPPAAFVSGGSTVRCVHCDYACLGQERLDRHVKKRHGHIGRNGRHKCTLTDPCACPDGWLLCAGRCISWRTTSASFSSARSGCQQMGAHLATARSEAEHQCTLGSKYGWVGATDEASEGVYVGEDGLGVMTIPTTWWQPGEPSDVTGGENCVMTGGSRPWADAECTRTYYYLCQLAGCHKPGCS
ncbi:Histone-lysine N-methyltransferase PRDM9 [Amphibalanus amphitrite]|uniref:Histone-lysine N-methyltransferase PRDM9 n=1 Tax=Amphibalanus amphitrite TaxID=1232801 RepID=A0A6A4W1T1_AMPAM|nr:Histone-lysine N-methyltransferase PRDM9 [Amphibalanus amphitrite]